MTASPPDPADVLAEQLLDEVLAAPADECECGDPCCGVGTGGARTTD